ncbi:hypothetical protein AVEN_209745-1 [Araneus ventricosus]|uniref:Uncharacterized protein n=1 Tax=Araneus ventricosus TaxID=182803 RepID=A0A4Y2CC89_ARAVE|nr:hypothetical protein AVEN_209745-1 [Araneus ventricosus]
MMKFIKRSTSRHIHTKGAEYNIAELPGSSSRGMSSEFRPEFKRRHLLAYRRVVIVSYSGKTHTYNTDVSPDGIPTMASRLAHFHRFLSLFPSHVPKYTVCL